MDAIITVVRFPLAMIASIFILCIGWPVEFVVGLLAFPIKAIAWSRDQLKTRYTGWPFTTFGTLRGVWEWVFLDETTPPYYDGESPPQRLGDYWSNIFAL